MKPRKTRGSRRVGRVELALHQQAEDEHQADGSEEQSTAHPAATEQMTRARNEPAEEQGGGKQRAFRLRCLLDLFAGWWRLWPAGWLPWRVSTKYTAGLTESSQRPAAGRWKSRRGPAPSAARPVTLASRSPVIMFTSLRTPNPADRFRARRRSRCWAGAGARRGSRGCRDARRCRAARCRCCGRCDG